MKNLKELLIKESKGWEVQDDFQGQDLSYSASKPFLWLNPDGETLGFVSESLLKEWFEDDVETANEILKLKPGELYDADGGINLYIRIK